MRTSKRIYHGSFFGDPELCGWVRDKRWFYLSLWSVAEDSGCEEFNTLGLKMYLYPSPLDFDISQDIIYKWMMEFEKDRKLIFYNANEKIYFFLINFHKYQKLKSARKPMIPLPPWINFTNYETNISIGKYEINNEMLQDYINQKKSSQIPLDFHVIKPAKKPYPETKPESKPEKKVLLYEPDSKEIKLADLFYAIIKKILPEAFKANNLSDDMQQKWADIFRKIIELDKEKPEEIEAVINWIPSSWWGKEGAGAINSPSKFRQKKPGDIINCYQRMLQQMKKDSGRLGESKDITDGGNYQ